MTGSWDVWTSDNGLHFLGGNGFAAGMIAAAHFTSPWVVLVSVPIAGAEGFRREWRQHRTDVPRWTKHRIAEALSWVVGAAFGSTVYLLATLLT